MRFFKKDVCGASPQSRENYEGGFMKLGEIKLEALRVMNINNDSILNLENMDSILGEKRFAKYLNNMLCSINRAIDIINHKNILPEKKLSLDTLLTTYGVSNNRFDLAKTSDVMAISRIVYEEGNTYISRVPYEKEGSVLVVDSRYNPKNLSVVYYPRIASIGEDISDDDDIPGLPDNLARLIPYYIKFDLYQEDEPDLAVKGKETFEEGLKLLTVKDGEVDYLIEKVYFYEE
jgi:hypothetical protein